MADSKTWCDEVILTPPSSQSVTVVINNVAVNCNLPTASWTLTSNDGTSSCSDVTWIYTGYCTSGACLTNLGLPTFATFDSTQPGLTF